MSENELPSYGNSTVFQKINGFLTTPLYIGMIMLLTLLSNLFGIELWVYSIFVLICLYLCIYGDNLLPLLPILIACYIAPSKQNNPGKNPDSVFLTGAGSLWLICLASLAAVALIYRVIRDRKKFFRLRRKLLPSLLLLAATYFTAGIGSNGYTENAGSSLVFAAANAGALLLPYLLLSDSFAGSERKDYLAWTGFGIGCVLLGQIAFIFLTGSVIQGGAIERNAIYTGWGMYNNIGALLAMMIPFPFYLATTYRRGWLGTLVSSVFLIGVLFTCSRASILCGCGIYFACVVLTLYYTPNSRANTLALMLFMGILCGLLLVFSRPLLSLFEPLLDKGLDPSNRDTIYADGLRLFSKYPIFGGSFFSTEYTPWGWSTVKEFTQFLPPRWHNTFVQMLASCGIVGLLAYLIHRLQTVLFLLRYRTPEKIFTYASLLVLLACSLFDCHFFNLGPTLFYSAALAFAEYH